MGLAIYRLGMFEVGVKIFKQILKINPRHYKSLITMTMLETMSIFKLTEKDPKDTEERIKVINSNMKILFEINPNDPMLIHLACEVLLIKNEDKRAESLLHRALEILKTMKISIEVKRCAQNFSIKEEGTGKSIKHVIDTTSQQDINSLELNKIVSEVNFSLGKIKHRENKAEDAQRYYRE